MSGNGFAIQSQSQVIEFIFIFQTGSGKSTTMYAKGKGVLQTSVGFLLERLGTSVLYISIVELYNNQFIDLLGSDRAKLEVDCKGKSIITSANKQKVATLSQLEEFIELAMANRTTKSTNQNRSSSRSHAFVIIEKESGENQLVLADLAGFESSENKENVRESISINGALTHFNKILLDMRQNQTPSYNSNHLTSFLQPVLKQSKAIVFYHISQSNIVKYLNLIDKLMNVRVSKRVPSSVVQNPPKKLRI